MPKLTFRIALAVLCAVLMLSIVIVGPSMCSRMLSAEKESKLHKAEGRAAIDAGAEAMNAAAAVGSNAATTDERVRQGNEEIDKAPAGNSNDAALRAACGMRSYRNSEQCSRMRQANPR